ncbi:hypothetical protein TNCV_2897321 [Trichonephila clavipes]|nr:hypothetical protein TNCV_2897321 [Trichonephila clavipes]
MMPPVRSRNAYQHISECDKGRMVAHRDCGLSYRRIAARVGRDPMTPMEPKIPLNFVKLHFGDGDLIILHHGQVPRTTPQLAPHSPNFYTTPTGRRLSSRQIQRASHSYTAGL